MNFLKASTCFSLSLIFSPCSYAEVTLFSKNNLTFSASLDASLGSFNNDNTNFGSGRVDYFSGQNTGDAQWQEGTLEPGVRLDYSTQNWGNLYGGISAVASFTAGDGDAGGYTRSGKNITTELLYAGWQSGHLFKDFLNENALSISYGRQNLQIGDGLLLYDGNFDMQSKQAYWLAPRTAFSRAGLIQLDAADYHTDLFYLKSEATWEGSSLVGINIERKQFYNGKIGAMYIHLLSSVSGAFNLVRDNMNVYSLNFNEISPTPLESLKFWGNFIYEEGDGKQGKKQAYAWYLEGQYGFSSLSWQPTLNYRYGFFSGDNQYGDQTNKNFDALFYGFSRGWGTWYQGEIVGTYLLFNSNMRSHMVKLSTHPTKNLGIGALFYRFDLDAANYYGTPVTNRHFADEIDVYADLTLSDHASISFAYGVALPGEGGKQIFGDNKASQLFEATLFLYF